MKPTAHDTSRSSMTKSAVCRFSVSPLAVAGLAVAQDQTPRAVRRSVNDPLPATLDQAPGDQPGQPPNVNAQTYPAQAGALSDVQAPPPGQYNAAPPPPPYNAPPPPPDVPAHLTLKAGTYVTVRMNQWLSSDRNKQGDTFTATLQQPIVVDGVVVAQRGQTVYGSVSQAQKAGRVEGTSRLGLQLTQLSLVDGNQAPVQSQMVTRNGQTSVGRDAFAIGATTGVGAAIGAGVNGGCWSSVFGAGAGAVVGILGVLLTRGKPTVIYPESVVTFQIQAPFDIATDKAPQAFQYVNSQPNYARYGQGPAPGYRGPGGYPATPAPGYGYGPAPAPVYGPGYPGYAYGYPYPYYGGFGVYVGPGWGYYGRGYGGFRR